MSPRQLGRGMSPTTPIDQTVAAELPGGKAGEIVAGYRRDAAGLPELSRP